MPDSVYIERADGTLEEAGFTIDSGWHEKTVKVYDWLTGESRAQVVAARELLFSDGPTLSEGDALIFTWTFGSQEDGSQG